MADSPEEIRKHLKLYWGIGGLLLVFTAITVIVAQFHLGTHGNNIVVGLAIAAFKMTLVALIFMHLKGEKKMIYNFLLFTVIFVIGLFALTYLHYLDPIPNPWPEFNTWPGNLPAENHSLTEP